MKKLFFFFLLFGHTLILATPPLHPKQVVEKVLKALSKRDMHTYYTHLTLDSRKKLYQSLMYKVFQMQKGTQNPKFQKEMELLLTLSKEDFFHQVGDILPAFYIPIYKKAKVVKFSVAENIAQVIFKLEHRFFPVSLIIEEDHWRMVHLE